MEPSEYTKQVSSVVKELIDASDKTQRDIANETGIALVTLNRKLNGVYPFDTTELWLIASCLGVSVSELVRPDVARIAA